MIRGSDPYKMSRIRNTESYLLVIRSTRYKINSSGQEIASNDQRKSVL
jgi:hypothetical protein